MTRHYFFNFLFLLAAIFISMSCSGATDETGVLQINVKAGTLIEKGEAMIISASGLAPSEYPVLIEAVDSTGKIASKAKLTADEDGKIGNVILAYDIGLSASSGDGALAPGEYTIRLTSDEGTAESQVTVEGEPDGPRVWACDKDGNLSNAFHAGDPVYAKAEKLVPGGTYRIWPVKDERAWNDGYQFKSLKDISPLSMWGDIPEYKTVIADQTGNIDVMELLPYATMLEHLVTDQFDIVLDAEPFGVFNSGTDAADGDLPTGVVIQDESTGGPRYQELAAKANYVYSDYFDVGDPVFIWLNPGEAANEMHTFVMKYIVNHLDNWVDGMVLADVTEGVEIDIVQTGCANEGLILAWAHAVLGKYDVLVDMNNNGIYDEGVDVLDGGAKGVGFTVVAHLQD